MFSWRMEKIMIHVDINGWKMLFVINDWECWDLDIKNVNLWRMTLNFVINIEILEKYDYNHILQIVVLNKSSSMFQNQR